MEASNHYSDSAERVAAGATALAGCLRFFAETFVFAFRAGALLKSLSGAAENIPGAQEEINFSIKLSDYF